jgi:hypothetical protein
MADEKKEPGLLNRRAILLAGSSIVAANALLPAAQAQTSAASPSTALVGSGSGKKPNIVVIYGDDIGITNLSCYSFGMMGYKTPNIDRIANEGLKFTDYYSEQSCTAGRSAFITGQSVFRTGLSKVGIPGSNIGLSTKDPTIAELLKPLGYATGQFGKNHLGDKDEFLPTNHGFDEFYGNLYHLNAEEDPEQPDYPKDPTFRRRFGPRGVIHSFADGRVEDTGPLTRKRMETIDDDIAARSADFMDRQVKANKPFFMWVCFTHMHLRTHAKPSSAPGPEHLPRRDDRSRQERRHRARQDRCTWDWQRHYRRLFDRQWTARKLLAGRGDHAFPQREGYKLGGRVSRSRRCALAGEDQARQRLNRYLPCDGLDAHISRRRG